MRDIQKYFDLIHRHTPIKGLIGLTSIRDTFVNTEWMRKQHIDMLINNALAIGQSAHVYARITPLSSQPAYGRGKERDSLGASVLYADLDSYTNALEALTALSGYVSKEIIMPPSMVVNSGHGLHAYWLLDRFYDDLDMLKGANKQLTIELNRNMASKVADSCFDLARVLRVPETWNIKGIDPILCTIQDYDDTRVYRLDQFTIASTDDSPSIEIWDSVPLPGDFMESLRDRDAKLAKRIKSEDGAKQQDAPLVQSGKRAGMVDRSRNDAFIAVRLLALGYDPGIVLSVLQSSEWFSGSRYQERGRYDYVLRTVNEALQQYNKSPDRYFNKSSYVAEKMGQELNTLHSYMYTGARLWRYHNGAYIADGEDFIKALIVDRLGKRWSSHASDETLRWIIDQSRVPIESINQHRGMINCANGMLDVATEKILPHDPRYRSTAQIPATYDKNVDTTQLDKFVSDILPEDTINVFWEYVGSAFLTDKYWPKAFIALVGPKNSGKSKILEWLVHFYGGIVNVKTISLQRLVDNRFSTAQLFGMLANIFSDLDESEAQNTGMIKTLTGDDFVDAERKFSDSFSFKNAARLFFSSNSNPAIKNPDDAFFERAHIIPCRNTFKGKNADPDIVQKLTTPANMSAGLLRVVQGLRRLLDQNQLSHSQTIRDAVEEYRFSADTITGFITNCAEDADFVTSKQEFYQMYKNTCISGGRKPVSEEKFFRRVKEASERYGISEEYKNLPNKDRVWCYRGRRPIKQTILHMPSVNIERN